MDPVDKNKELGDLKRELSTPKDLTDLSNEEAAGIIALHLIGFVAKPTGISEELYKKCVNAFNNNRGKFEMEAVAVLKVLREERGEK